MTWLPCALPNASRYFQRCSDETSCFNAAFRPLLGAERRLRFGHQRLFVCTFAAGSGAATANAKLASTSKAPSFRRIVFPRLNLPVEA